MKKLLTLPHYHTSAEIAALLLVDPALIDRMVELGTCPPCTWTRRWRGQRWAAETLPEWRQYLNTIDFDITDRLPPPAQMRIEPPTAAELRIAAKMCGIK
jgi:hypothetical protein